MCVLIYQSKHENVATTSTRDADNEKRYDVYDTIECVAQYSPGTVIRLGLSYVQHTRQYTQVHGKL